MTEETATRNITESQRPEVKPKVERYVRPKFVVALYKSGVTTMAELIEKVRAHELVQDLRKNVKHPRDDYFYKRNIHWALSDATKSGEIEGYTIKRRTAKKVVAAEAQLPGQQTIEAAVEVATPVINAETVSEEIPTL